MAAKLKVEIAVHFQLFAFLVCALRAGRFAGAFMPGESTDSILVAVIAD